MQKWDFRCVEHSTTILERSNKEVVAARSRNEGDGIGIDFKVNDDLGGDSGEGK